MPPRAWGIVALVGLVAVGAWWVDGRVSDSRVLKAEAQAEEWKIKAEKLSAAADEHLALADQFATQIGEQDSRIAALKAKLAKVQASGGGVSTIPTVPAGHGNPSAVANVEGIKDQIIEAQNKQIDTLKGEVVELRKTVDLQAQAIDAERKRARGLELALDAQKHAIKANRWKGRLEGFAAGFSAAYVMGRVQR